MITHPFTKDMEHNCLELYVSDKLFLSRDTTIKDSKSDWCTLFFRPIWETIV